MNRATEIRLRKLETETAGHRSTRLFVIEGDTKAERQAQVDDLIAAGFADDADTFVHTGVHRSPLRPHA